MKIFLEKVRQIFLYPIAIVAIIVLFAIIIVVFTADVVCAVVTGEEHDEMDTER